MVLVAGVVFNEPRPRQDELTRPSGDTTAHA